MHHSIIVDLADAFDGAGDGFEELLGGLELSAVEVGGLLYRVRQVELEHMLKFLVRIAYEHLRLPLQLLVLQDMELPLRFDLGLESLVQWDEGGVGALGGGGAVWGR